MKRINLLNVAILITIILLFITACSPDRVLVDEFDQVPAGDSTGDVQETEEPIDEPEAVESKEPPPVADVTGSVPEDIPVMDGAYQLQAGTSGKNVVYQIDSTIEEVVTFYQEELPNYAWELAGPPDNVVASIATMLRENVAGDRLAINMQANNLGGFVRLTLTISRAD